MSLFFLVLYATLCIGVNSAPSEYIVDYASSDVPLDSFNCQTIEFNETIKKKALHRCNRWKITSAMEIALPEFM